MQRIPIQRQQLFETFKLKYNKMSFLYESEKIINQKKEEEIICYQIQLEDVQRAVREKELALKELHSQSEKNKKKQAFIMKIERAILISLLVLVAAMFAYSKWQVRNTLDYKEQYDVLFEKFSALTAMDVNNIEDEVPDQQESNSSEEILEETTERGSAENISTENISTENISTENISTESSSTEIKQSVQEEPQVPESEGTVMPETTLTDILDDVENSELIQDAGSVTEEDIFANIKNERIIIPDSITSISGIHEGMLNEIATITKEDIDAIEDAQNTTSESPYYLGKANVYGMHQHGFMGRYSFGTNIDKVSLYRNEEHQYVKFAYGTGSKYYNSYKYIIAISADAFCDRINSNSTLEDITKVLGNTAYNSDTNMEDDEYIASHFSSSQKVNIYTFHLTEGDEVGFVFDEEGKICDYIYLRLENFNNQ